MNEKIKEQLKPLHERLRQRESLVRPISQIQIALPRNETSFVKARARVLDWMNERAGRRIPARAFRGEAFSLDEIGAQRVEAVTLDAPRYWSARIDDADKLVPTKTWTTEVGLAQDAEGNIVFGCRLTASTRGTDDSPNARSIPNFVKGLLKDVGGMLDGRVVSGGAWVVYDEADARALASLIRRESRRGEVVAVSLPEASEDVEQAAVDAESLAGRLAGAAHVVVVTGPASFHLSDQFGGRAGNGRACSVYRGAIRIYRTSWSAAKAGADPVILPSRIATLGGAKACEEALVRQILERTVQSVDAERTLPSFVEVKRAAAERAIEAARADDGADKVMLELMEREVADLRNMLDEERSLQEGLLKHAESERDQALAVAEELRETNRRLQARLQSLMVRPGAAAPETVIPEDYADIEQWCETHLSGHVHVHSRAFQGLKKSNYQDLSLIYRALLLMRDHYVPMRRQGGQDLCRKFEEECRKLNLIDDHTGEYTRACEMGDEYFVRHRGVRQYLSRHLKKGNSKDERRCFRLYYFFDEETDQVVVGWLPSHLDSRVT